MDIKSSYEAVNYPDYTFPQTNPVRLASLAAFHDVEAPDPTRARVLELGCGTGANLISFAYAMPDAGYVGIDLSVAQIARGNGIVDQLGLSNVELVTGDLMEFTSERFGYFDYIIAHGLFSWVPPEVRERILQIYSECLSPNGIGYVSYNVYPGCYLRRMVWEQMKFQAAGTVDPMGKIRQGIAFIDFISDLKTNEPLYQSVLAQELKRMRERSVENVFHDEFSEYNEPLYFHEFAEKIGSVGLQFLCEAETVASTAADLEPEQQMFLHSLSDDPIMSEQYLDFAKGRRFRGTVVCRTSVDVQRTPSSDVIEQFYISSHARPDGKLAPLADAKPQRFKGKSTGAFETNWPLAKAALVRLAEKWSRGLRFRELVDECADRIGEDAGKIESEEEQKLKGFLLMLFQSGFVEFSIAQPAFADLTAKPHASEFARWQAANGSDNISTMAGINIDMENPMMRAMIYLLDGTRGRDELIAELSEMIDVPATEQAAFSEALPLLVDDNLKKFAAAGLFIA